MVLDDVKEYETTADGTRVTTLSQIMHTLFPFNKICDNVVTRVPSAVVSYSLTSSRTMLTYSSKPLSVPTSSLSPCITTHRREPTHLATSSRGRRRSVVAIF